MREHRYDVELPHSAQRIWALMQDYERWTAYAPMVLEVQVLHPGDAGGNGLLRRVVYKLPFGRRGAAQEHIAPSDRAGAGPAEVEHSPPAPRSESPRPGRAPAGPPEGADAA